MRLVTRPPGLIQRIWYRRLGLPVPFSTGSTGPWHADWVRLLPYRWRRLHRTYARFWGFFWLPCPLCDQPYGGHECGGVVPDPLEGPGWGVSVCSRCTRAGRAQATTW